MKFNKWTLGLAAIAAIGAMALTNALRVAPGVDKGKEGIAAANELVVTDLAAVTPADQIGQLDVAFAIKEDPALVDIAANEDALANAPNTATSADQVALNAAKITDQLALKITASAKQFAFTATGAAQLGSS